MGALLEILLMIRGVVRLAGKFLIGFVVIAAIVCIYNKKFDISMIVAFVLLGAIAIAVLLLYDAVVYRVAEKTGVNIVLPK